MTPEPRPAKVPAPHSTEGTSAPDRGEAQTQLSSDKGVQPDVSSVAMSSVTMDRGLLALGGVAQPEPVEADTSLPERGRSDAEIMLRVKAGDDSTSSCASTQPEHEQRRARRRREVGSSVRGSVNSAPSALGRQSAICTPFGT